VGLRREERAKARIKYLQDAQKSFKRTIKAKNDRIEVLKVALEDTRKLVSERNSEARELKRRTHELDQTVDSLISERDELCEQLDGELAKHRAEVMSLQEQLSGMNKIANLSTFSKRTYNSGLR